MIEIIDDRYDYGEERCIVLGRVANTVLVVVYTWRGDVMRIISARKATRREQQSYYARLTL